MFGLSALKTGDLLFTDLSLTVAVQASVDAPAINAHCFKKSLRSIFMTASLFMIPPGHNFLLCGSILRIIVVEPDYFFFLFLQVVSVGKSAIEPEPMREVS
jgi:hypothetical protein